MTPVEIVAIVFVVGSFVAIGARFTPRDAFGVRRAPRPIDDSVGMYAVRRLRRRSTLTEADIVQPSLEEILQRIGVAPATTTSESEVDAAVAAAPEASVSASTALTQTGAEAAPGPALDPRPQLAGPMPPGDLLAAMRAAVDRPPRTITRRMPQAALTAQRRVGGLVAAALIVAAGLGGASLTASPGGAVLEAVGTPAPARPTAAPASPALPGASVAPSGAPGAEGG